MYKPWCFFNVITCPSVFNLISLSLLYFQNMDGAFILSIAFWNFFWKIIIFVCDNDVIHSLSSTDPQFILIWKHNESWLVWLSGLSTGLWTKGSTVQFPVREHAWVEGCIPSRGCARGNHTMMFLSLSFCLPSAVSKNK